MYILQTQVHNTLCRLNYTTKINAHMQADYIVHICIPKILSNIEDFSVQNWKQKFDEGLQV